MKYRFTEEAIVALDEIARYIALDNEAAADRVTDKVLETCELLTEMSHLGRHPEFSNDLGLLYYQTMKYPHYLVFYRVEKSEIVVVDIVHGARDLPDLFGDN